MMRASCIIGAALLGAGCSTSTQQSDALTSKQVQALALELANANALEVYHHQPFRGGEPAHFERGRWVWVARQGYGQGDIEVTVELAVDGSTNHVDLRLLDNRQIRTPEEDR